MRLKWIAILLATVLSWACDSKLPPSQQDSSLPVEKRAETSLAGNWKIDEVHSQGTFADGTYSFKQINSMKFHGKFSAHFTVDETGGTVGSVTLGGNEVKIRGTWIVEDGIISKAGSQELENGVWIPLSADSIALREVESGEQGLVLTFMDGKLRFVLRKAPDIGGTWTAFPESRPPDKVVVTFGPNGQAQMIVRSDISTRASGEYAVAGYEILYCDGPWTVSEDGQNIKFKIQSFRAEIEGFRKIGSKAPTRDQVISAIEHDAPKGESTDMDFSLDTSNGGYSLQSGSFVFKKI